MKKFDEITVEGKVIPLLITNNGTIVMFLKDICDVLKMNFEEEKQRISQNRFFNMIFIDDHIPIRYAMGYAGSIGFDENRDLELRKTAMKWNDEIYDFLTADVEETL